MNEKRRSRFADFFIRLPREKPLGTFGGLIVLVFLVVAILPIGWRRMATTRYTWSTG